MAHPFEQPRSIYYQSLTRDGARCVYCGKDILETYDAFCSSHLDHLKPHKNGGADDELDNRVTSCGVCNNLKGTFDPSPAGPVTPQSFQSCIDAARDFINGKRNGSIDNSYYRDYQYWLKELNRTK
jgi:hypothetical protein